MKNFLALNEPKKASKNNGKQKELKSNLTDNESSMMYSSHGTIQGYNTQGLVDSKHQVIVLEMASDKGTDPTHVPPVIDGAKVNMKAIGEDEDYFKDKIFLADSSYYSPENIEKCEKESLEA